MGFRLVGAQGLHELGAQVPELGDVLGVSDAEFQMEVGIGAVAAQHVQHRGADAFEGLFLRLDGLGAQEVPKTVFDAHVVSGLS